MFDVLIREVVVRFNLGDKALSLLQMLLACMTRQDTGGLPGFLKKLKATGLGPTVQSWLGGGPSAKAVTASQIENALGSAGGLLEQLTGRLDAPRDDVADALGYLLPYIVGKLTPGGSLPGSLPAEIAPYYQFFHYSKLLFYLHFLLLIIYEQLPAIASL